MVANAQKKWTVEEYLAFERKSEERHEYIDGVVYPVGHPPRLSTHGAGRRHSLILVNVISSFVNQLADATDEAYAINMRIEVNSARFIYPDVRVVHDEPRFTDNEFDTLLNPTVIVEVLSPSTEIYDRGKKLDYYQTLESLQEYLLIAQDMVRIEHYVRQTTDGWFYSQVKTLESVIELPSINCTLSLTDVYDKVTFPPDGNPIET